MGPNSTNSTCPLNAQPVEANLHRLWIPRPGETAALRGVGQAGAASARADDEPSPRALARPRVRHDRENSPCCSDRHVLTIHRSEDLGALPLRIVRTPTRSVNESVEAAIVCRSPHRAIRLCVECCVRDHDAASSVAMDSGEGDFAQDGTAAVVGDWFVAEIGEDGVQPRPRRALVAGPLGFSGADVSL